MRWTALIAAVLLSGLALAACQSRGVTSATPQTVIGTVSTPTTTYPIVPAFHKEGNPVKGKVIFLQNCGSCHTLADAKTTGVVGPDLDAKKPTYQHVTAQVTNGGGGMPGFKSQLTTQQIADVAAYVVTATGGSVP